MSSQISFYRGAAGASLPEQKHDGAIYIVDSGDSLDDNGHGRGDLFVDVSSSKRLRITPDSSSVDIAMYTETEIANMINVTSIRGMIYIITDDEGEHQTGIKIGDGLAYINDLPTFGYFSNQAITAFRKHVSAIAGSVLDEVNSGSGDYRLILDADITYNS